MEIRVSIIRAKAEEYGLKVTAHDQIVTVTGNFKPGDSDAYMKIEDNAHRILRMFRQVRTGSTWGTDSGSVGGSIALENGHFTLNMSGVEKRLASKFYER
jgi:PHD/YefM family antitoxin component YafN of YafNO toxin-antitoxin module